MIPYLHFKIVKIILVIGKEKEASTFNLKGRNYRINYRKRKYLQQLVTMDPNYNGRG